MNIESKCNLWKKVVRIVFFALWLFLKSNAGKNKQFLILIPRHPRRCGDVRKLEKNLFGWGLFEKTEIYPLNEAKSWILHRVWNTFRTKLLIEFFNQPEKKLFSHKNLENPWSIKKVPNWHLLKIATMALFCLYMDFQIFCG